VQKFAKNPAVSFGDINLSEEQIRGNHNPGAGGWPTVKYFNKQTGYDGQKYEQKTSDRICEELGKDEYMEAFVMEQVRAAAAECAAVRLSGHMLQALTVKLHLLALGRAVGARTVRFEVFSSCGC